MSVNIHGKKYITVAERVQMAHKDLNEISITTEIIPSEASVIVKATVVTPKGTFTGLSAANPTKLIEKQSPYEVAETSAVGRALGFAGYGIVEGIATAEEIKKVEVDTGEEPDIVSQKASTSNKCPYCGAVGPYHKKGCPNASLKQVENFLKKEEI